MKVPHFSLQNKTAIITGGAKGIGAAICQRFVEAGARVAGLDLDDRAGLVLAESLAVSGEFQYLHCDVSDENQVLTSFDQIFQRYGSIDILVNNAGVSHIGNLENTGNADMDRMYSINVKSVYHCLKAGIPYMKKSGGGAIVNMSSVAAVTGLSERFAYSMSKGAVYTMTFSVARDYIREHIRCNAVGPARIHTPFVDDYLERIYPGQEKEMFEKLSSLQPIGRMGTPEEVAALVHFLCSEEASFITGNFFPIDGGFLRLNT